MEQIFNYIDAGIIVCDIKGKILFGNNTILSRLEFNLKELVGLKISDIADKNHSETNEVINNLYMNHGVRVNLKLNTKNKGKKLFYTTLGKDLWQGEEAVFLVLEEAICPGKHTRTDLEKILDNIPYDVWLKDSGGRYVYVNQKHADAIGRKREHIITTTDFDLWCKSDSEYFRSIDKEVIKYNKPILEQHKVKGIGRDECWFETYKAPLKNNITNEKYVMGISRNITLSKRMEQELSRSHNDMIALNNLLPTNEYDARRVVKSVKDDLFARLNADGGTIWIYEQKNAKLKPVISFGLSERFISDFQDIVIPSEYFNNPANWEAEGVLSIDERKHLIVGKEKLKKLGMKYCGLYKITYNNEIIGVIHTLYKDKSHFKMKNDDFMKTMCNQLGMIIKNDMLSRDIKSEFFKREEAEEELQTFLDTAVDLVAIIGPDRKFKKVNRGWTEILGWTEKELYEMNSYDILHPDDVVLTSKMVEELHLNKVLKGAVNRYVSKTGEVYWFEWSSRYIPDKEISVCTGRDITKLKEAEKQKEAYEKALALEKVKSEFFANISHEFKTPLNIILTAIQIIMKSDDEGLTTPKLERYMYFIKQNSYRLLRLVNNLIDITKIDTGYYEINLENENIISVVEDITMSIAEYTAEKGIELIFDTDVEEVMAACDPDKIERIMLNLLSNAIKYSKPEGIIKVDIKSNGDKVVVSVQDNGIGIEKEKICKIFDRFSQVKNTLTRDCEGSGIGLSLVKSLVEMHGGNIWAESEFGKGTRFVFELPVKILDEKDVIIESKDVISSIVEKCNIEFSDIYN